MKTSGMIAVGFLLTVAVLVTPGCQDENAALVARARSDIEDVPVPEGFELVDMRSRSWSNGSLRFVDYLFRGDAHKLAVIRFYEKQMPVGRWSPVTNQTLQGETEMDYQKDRENCRVTISTEGWYKPTFIHVSIWPEADGGAPPASP
jgi:hypothetical protein